MMINTSGNEGQYTVVESSGSQGGISLFNKINNRQNLVDGDYTNYAEATNVLSLIQFGSLAGVHSSQDIALQGGGKTRVGFVMQTNNQLLGADVLKFFFIRLYKDGKEVFSGLTAENDAVGVGLVGNDGSKLRFYVETDRTFDQVELWTARLAECQFEYLPSVLCFLRTCYLRRVCRDIGGLYGNDYGAEAWGDYQLCGNKIFVGGKCGGYHEQPVVRNRQQSADSGFYCSWSKPDKPSYRGCKI